MQQIANFHEIHKFQDQTETYFPLLKPMEKSFRLYILFTNNATFFVLLYYYSRAQCLYVSYETINTNLIKSMANCI